MNWISRTQKHAGMHIHTLYTMRAYISLSLIYIYILSIGTIEIQLLIFYLKQWMFDGNILHPSLKENEYMYSKCLPLVIVFCLKTYIKKLNIISTMNKYMQCIVLKSAGFIIIPIYN